VEKTLALELGNRFAIPTFPQLQQQQSFGYITNVSTIPRRVTFSNVLTGGTSAHKAVENSWSQGIFWRSNRHSRCKVTAVTKRRLIHTLSGSHKINFEKMASCCCDEPCELVEKLAGHRSACIFQLQSPVDFLAALRKNPPVLRRGSVSANPFHRWSAFFPRLSHIFFTQPLDNHLPGGTSKPAALCRRRFCCQWYRHKACLKRT